MEPPNYLPSLKMYQSVQLNTKRQAYILDNSTGWNYNIGKNISNIYCIEQNGLFISTWVICPLSKQQLTVSIFCLRWYLDSVSKVSFSFFLKAICSSLNERNHQCNVSLAHSGCHNIHCDSGSAKKKPGPGSVLPLCHGGRLKAFVSGVFLLTAM